MKRLFDILAAVMGLIILSPLLVMIALAIKLTSPGPVLYLGQRVGKDGRLFRMAKFRSMAIDADKRGSSITTKGDPRITRIGRILRKTKLDELPQLFNVLIGQMSIVGPRPETPPWVALYTDEQLRVLSVRPGITDTAQILFRHEEEYLKTDRHYSALMQYKLAKQIEYVDNRSFLSDLRAIVGTLFAIAQRRPSAEALRIYEELREEKNCYHC